MVTHLKRFFLPVSDIQQEKKVSKNKNIVKTFEKKVTFYFFFDTPAVIVWPITITV